MRKKKLAILLLGFIAAAGCAIGLAACGGNDGGQGGNEPQEHVHTLIHVEAVEATCTEAGNSEYWVCSECGGFFSDENGENEIWDMSSIFLPIDENNHNWGEWAVTIEATCTQEGEETRVCLHDNFHTDTREIEKLPHNLTHVEAVEATCTEEGNVEYWVCSECGGYFSDEDGENQIEDKLSVIILINEDNHDWGEWTVTTAATCTAVGEETRVCSHDSSHIETREIEKLPHNLTHVEAVEATCTEEGNIEYWVCSECGGYFSDENGTTEITEITVAAKGHTLIYHEAIEATCTETGMVEYWECSECGGFFSDSEGTTEITEITVAAKGHSLVHHEAVEATCTETGTAEYWECSVCGKYFSDSEGTTEITDITVAAKGHSLVHHEALEATCTETGNIEYWECSECGSYFSDEDGENEIKNKSSVILPIDEDNHAWLKWTTVTEATCTSKGEETRVCLHNSSHTESREIAKLPHTYEDGVCTVCGLLEPTEGLEYTAYSEYAAVTSIGTTTETDIIIADEYEGLPVTSIGSSAFKDCISLTSVTIQKGVTSIGYDAFRNCTSLTSIIIPDSVTYIDSNAFYGCSSLKSVTIPDGVNSIYYDTFYGCSSLESITIPDSVTSIGSDAFAYCTSLTSVTLQKGVTSIGSDAFYRCYKLVEVYNLSSLEITAGSSGNGYVGYYALDVYNSLDAQSKLSTDDNGYVFYNDDDTVYLVGYTGSDTALTLPESFNGKSYEIYMYAFYGNTSITNITIPDNVTSIGYYAFYGCTSLTSITIGNTVTSIGSSAFDGCSKLTEINYNATECADLSSYNNVFYKAGQSGSGITVNIGANVKKIPAYLFYPWSNNSYSPKIVNVVFAENSVCESIGSHTFEGCSSLESIIIPDSVTSIGSDAFDFCYKLVEVYNLSSLEITAGSSDNGYVGHYALDVYTSLDTPSKLSTDDNGYIFYNDDDIIYLIEYTGSDTALTLPESFNDKNYEIYKYAFYENTFITSIIIPDSVTSIGDYAFNGCTSLISVTIGNNVTSIDRYAFYGCSSLESINIPDTVTSIGDDAFYNTAYYKDESNWENNVLYIGNHLIKANETISGAYEVKRGTLTIADYAFRGCTSLESVTIPDSVTSIGSDAFYRCSALTEINYNATECADLSSSNYVFAFAGQSGDGISVNIGANVKKIPAYLFYPYDNSSYSPKIVSVVFAENSVCESIGNYAFYNCSGVTSIAVPDSVTSIGNLAFYNCTSLTSVTIGNGVTSIGIYAFSSCSGLTSITIPDGVTSIGEYAFRGCDKLVEVYNLSSLEITAGSWSNGGVGHYALDVYTSLDTESKLSTDDNGYIFYADGDTVYLVNYTGNDTELTLPDSFDGKNYEIYQYAFYGKTSITSVTIGNGVTSIGSFVFRNCSSLESITIPDTVTSIGGYAFYGCKSLISVTIGNNMESIGNSAFYNCSSLNTVYYNGTAEDWSSFSIGSSNTNLTNATRYYYSESEPVEEGNYWRYVDGEIVIWTKE